MPNNLWARKRAPGCNTCETMSLARMLERIWLFNKGQIFSFSSSVVSFVLTDRPQQTFQFSLVQSLSCVRLFATPWTAARQTSLSITNSGSLLKCMSHCIGEVIQPYHHLSFPSPPASFPASRSFPMSQFFASDSQSIGLSGSASFLPMNIQD